MSAAVIGALCFAAGFLAGAEVGRTIYNKKMAEVRGIAEAMKGELDQ